MSWIDNRYHKGSEKSGFLPSHLNFDRYMPQLTEGCLVEIGADRGEGSTQHMAELARQYNRQFYSVDFDEDIATNARTSVMHLDNAHVFYDTGEHFMTQMFPQINKKICAAYLDNFDWQYKDGNEKMHQRQIREYKDNHNTEMTNLNSQLVHFQQTIEIVKHSADKCLVVFDDTWQNPDQTFNGKGGSAIQYLLLNGFKVLNDVPMAETVVKGLVILGKNVT